MSKPFENTKQLNEFKMIPIALESESLRIPSIPFGKEVALESIDNSGGSELSFLALKFKGVKEVIKKIFNHSDDFPMVDVVKSRHIQKAGDTLQKVGFSALEKYVVRLPEGLVFGKGESYYNYLCFLRDSLKELETVDRDLLKPIEVWCSTVLSSKETPMQYIVSDTAKKSSRYNDDITKTFNKFIDPNVGSNRSTVSIHVAFKNTRDYKDCGPILDEISAISRRVNAARLVSRVDVVSDLFKRVVELHAREQILADVKKHVVNELSVAMFNSAKSMELLAIIIFNAKTAAVAYNELTDKINRELK